MKALAKPFYLTLGVLSLILGFIGVFLPLLPTTVFIILAAYCFSKSSARLHQWLLDQKLFGPIIKDWEQYGVIEKKIKWLATSMILIMISYPLLFKALPLLIKICIIVCISLVLLYIWSRPSERF